MSGIQCKKAKIHLYAVLYLCYTEEKCEEPILAAIFTNQSIKKPIIWKQQALEVEELWFKTLVVECTSFLARYNHGMLIN